MPVRQGKGGGSGRVIVGKKIRTPNIDEPVKSQHSPQRTQRTQRKKANYIAISLCSLWPLWLKNTCYEAINIEHPTPDVEQGIVPEIEIEIAIAIEKGWDLGFDTDSDFDFDFDFDFRQAL